MRRAPWLGALLLLGAQEARADEPLEVLVEGDKRRAGRDRTAAAFVLSEEELRAPGATTAELLSRAPGVQVTRTGASPDLATAQVRGASGAQTPVYLAGIRLNDEVTGVADLSTVPLALLGRIEVYRGVVPLWADRSAIGGAIVLEPKLAQRPGAGAVVGVGSFGETSLLGRLDAAGRAGGWLARASTLVRVERSDNDYVVHDDRGTPLFPADDRDFARPNADARALELLHVSRFERSGGARVTLVLSSIAREQGVTGLSVLPASLARTSVARTLAGVSVRLPFQVLGQRAWVELVSSGLAGRSELEDPAYELSLLARRVSTEGLRGSLAGRFGVDIAQRARLELGFVGESELLSIDRDGAFSTRARRASARASLSAAVRVVDQLDVVAMGAVDCQSTGSFTADGPRGGEACGLLEPTARLGVRVQPAQPLLLFVNLSRAFRAPTLGELFGTSAILRGNPGLSREEAIGADFGARLAGEAGPVKGDLEVFVFGRRSDELIAFQRSSLGVVRPFNVAQAETLGLEATTSFRLFGHLELSLAATLLDPRDTSPDRPPGNDLLPYQARLVLVPGLAGSFRPDPRGLVSRLGASTRVVYRSERVADRAALVRLPEQASWDAEVVGSFFSGTLSLRLAARNLLDLAMFDVVGFPLAGRSFHATLEGGWP